MKIETSNYKLSHSKRLSDVRYNELSTQSDSRLNDIDPVDIAYTAEQDNTFPHQYPVYSEKQIQIDSRESQNWKVRHFIEGTELRMTENRCLRSTLTLLHVCIGLAAGFYSVYAAVGEGYTLQCLPPLLDHFGDAIPFKHGLPDVCHCIFYSMVFVSGCSLLMAICIYSCWENSCVVFMNLSVTVITAAISVFGGTVFSVHYMLWCDSLSEVTTRLRCADAAKFYNDKHRVENMTMYHTKLEMQQINLWALFPVALMAIVMYASAIYLAGVNDTKGQSIRGYVVLQEETAPLTDSETRNLQRQLKSFGSVDDYPTPDVTEGTIASYPSSSPGSSASAPYDGRASHFYDNQHV